MRRWMAFGFLLASIGFTGFVQAEEGSLSPLQLAENSQVSISDLKAALKDPSYEVRFRAVVIILDQNTVLLIPDLIENLGDKENPYFRALSADALRKMTKQDFGTNHDKWATWWKESQKHLKDAADQQNARLLDLRKKGVDLEKARPPILTDGDYGSRPVPHLKEKAAEEKSEPVTKENAEKEEKSEKPATAEAPAEKSEATPPATPEKSEEKTTPEKEPALKPAPEEEKHPGEEKEKMKEEGKSEEKSGESHAEHKETSVRTLPSKRDPQVIQVNNENTNTPSHKAKNPEDDLFRRFTNSGPDYSFPILPPGATGEGRTTK